MAGDAPAEPRHALHPPREAAAPPHRPVLLAAAHGTMPRWSCASDLRPGDVIPGPAIIAEQNATTVVEPGWEAALTALDHLVLTRATPAPCATPPAPPPTR